MISHETAEENSMGITCFSHVLVFFLEIAYIAYYQRKETIVIFLEKAL
jgi:hypothetical protein